VRFQTEPMTPLTPAEGDALRLRAAKVDEVFSGRTIGELILDVRETHADASAWLLGAALYAILAQCLAEPFEPWPAPSWLRSSRPKLDRHRGVPTVSAHLVVTVRAPWTISAGMRPRVRRPVCTRSKSSFCRLVLHDCTAGFSVLATSRANGLRVMSRH
jgi:hypothetical protein